MKVETLKNNKGKSIKVTEYISSEYPQIESLIKSLDNFYPWFQFQNEEGWFIFNFGSFITTERLEKFDPYLWENLTIGVKK